MNGQMKSFKEKQQIADEFINRTKPYAPQGTLKFDLRGYAKYIKEHNISGKSVPEDVVKRFQL